MSGTHEPERDDLEDRLMDQALRELLGGETPPDLSGKIAAAVEKQSPVSLRRKEEGMNKSKKRILSIVAQAAAICLILGVLAGLLLPAVQMAKRPADEVRQRTSFCSL